MSENTNSGNPPRASDSSRQEPTLATSKTEQAASVPVVPTDSLLTDVAALAHDVNRRKIDQRADSVVYSHYESDQANRSSSVAEEIAARHINKSNKVAMESVQRDADLRFAPEISADRQQWRAANNQTLVDDKKVDGDLHRVAADIASLPVAIKDQALAAARWAVGSPVNPVRIEAHSSPNAPLIAPMPGTSKPSR